MEYRCCTTDCVLTFHQHHLLCVSPVEVSASCLVFAGSKKRKKDDISVKKTNTICSCFNVSALALKNIGCGGDVFCVMKLNGVNFMAVNLSKGP